ncbi:MAG: sigma-70 family RNA polymerase sigma factor [Planctomycetes bacterium]|nr:sigma-70 family RNA polymerase sigma factor [Planctomycetota bacterium]
MEARTDMDRLAEQLGWVRRLAHGLVSDPHLAEDLVQETWLAYLRARPDTSRPLEPWFARVLTNFARRARRGNSRRVARETDAAREEALPSSADVYERAALHRELVGAVLALDEPYRGTLLLRYVDELPPREIARRHRVPVRTVNTRLRRGLAKLRATLDADHERDRERWLGCLIAFAEPSPRDAIGVAGSWIAALLLLAGGVTIAWSLASRNAAVEPTIGAVSTPTPRGGSETLAVADSADATSSRRAHTLPAGPPRRAWTGRVEDDGGRPIANARVELEAPARARFGRFDPPVDVESTKLGAAVTDALGRFRLRATIEGQVELRVAANEFVTTTVPLGTHAPHAAGVESPGAALARAERAGGESAGAEVAGAEVAGAEVAGAEVIVRLERATKLRGRVVHAESGAVHGGIAVYTSVRGGRADSSATEHGTFTQDDGSWSLASAPSGRIVVFAYDAACGAHASVELEIGPGDTGACELLLEPAARIRGLVLDATTGRPAESVHVGIEGHPRSFGTTDRTGSFELAAVRALERVVLRAGGAGFATQRFVVDPLPRAGAELALELVPGRSAHGTIVDVDGSPLAGVFVAAVADEWHGGEHRHDRVVGRTDSSGRFVLRGLRRDLAHTLLAAHAGRAAFETEFPSTERELDDVDLGVVQLARGGSAVGRVVDEYGAPRAAVELVCFRLGPRGTTSRDVSPSLFAAGRVFSRTESDASGRFEFQDLPEGAWLLALGADAARERVTVEFDLAADERWQRELVAARGLSVVGRVLDASGAPVEDAAIVATSAGKSRDARGAHSRSDGSFEIVGLVSGEHTLVVTPPAGRALVPARSVARAPADDVEFRLAETVALGGRVVGADGAPLAFARIAGQDELGFPLATTWADRDGTFVLRVPPGRGLELAAFETHDTAGGQRRVDPTPCATLHVATERASDAAVELRALR